MIEKPQWRGEPAFPQYSLVAEGVFCEGGMTLRDYFAAAFVKSGAVFPRDVPINTPERVAQQAYELADAMLKAREHGNS